MKKMRVVPYVEWETISGVATPLPYELYEPTTHMTMTYLDVMMGKMSKVHSLPSYDPIPPELHRRGPPMMVDIDSLSIVDMAGVDIDTRYTSKSIP